jgi:hypothetical protein
MSHLKIVTEYLKGVSESLQTSSGIETGLEICHELISMTFDVIKVSISISIVK